MGDLTDHLDGLGLCVALAMIVALAPLPAFAQAKKTSPVVQPSCLSQAALDVLAGLSPEGDLILQGGGTVKLSGIRLPDAGPFRQQAIAWLSFLAGDAVEVRGANSRDRWDRRSVRLRLSADSRDLAQGLVEAGLALADPGTADAACPEDFLASEALARQRSLGLWADAGYKPIGTNQADRLKDRTGTFVIVEGRVRSVGERAQRTYLNFGGQWADDFTVIIPKKTWKRMMDRGIDAAAFRGRQAQGPRHFGGLARRISYR